MTALTLIRHGETDWNRDRRIQGSTDIPLNDNGRAQAHATAALLRERLVGAAPVTIVSSDLARARETAEIIADGLGVAPPRTYRGLRERSYGEAEGVEVEEFRARWGDWYTAEVPGAEPWPDLRARGIAALGRAVRDHRRATAPTSAGLVVVSHGALIRELMRHATAGELPPPGERLLNGSAHDFMYEREHLRLVAYAGLVA
ncbi:histidine phosphatase family protein [Microbacterium sp. M3]|uniref:Histidine phosphatase family protein n=1 Tax=Microbacterium arthrosphaerae TaxID=792652 RepID=A0ABU4GZA3_9MICO|nr:MULTISPECIES: histidine phosphatase family protein [Microbacterium]MDW4572412.1 histidine phosphatase family protein [Microbacterium arthrosphaerae]MDW7606267.1 histidine phosphatase family protein [Microbacterium sp. M3]